MSKFNWSNPPYKIKKDDTQSKVHDRSVYRTPGNEVELAYGTFTVLKAEKIDKVWYVILTDNNATFKIKQQQMGNKKLPKTRVIIEDTQPVIAGLLPAPMELIDRLVKQVKQLGEQYTMEDVSTVASGIKQKITYISTNLQELQHPNKRNICKQIYRNLLFEYHPDRPHGSTELTLYIQRKFELWINRI